MKPLLRIVTPAFLILTYFTSFAQSIDSSILQQQWKASWISVPGVQPNGYGVYLFRKQIDLSATPSSFIVHVSADNRYKLFVNDSLVSLGPARGDITHWNFETVDISPYLHLGKNTIGAKVWNEAEWRPEAQITLRTGFILQGASAAEQIINTDTSWKSIRDSSYKPIRVSLPTYYVAGPGEQIDMNVHISNWEKNTYNDSLWKKAQVIFKGSPKNIKGPFGTPEGWLLVPSAIPPMELTRQRLLKVRHAVGVTVPPLFPTEKVAVIIPANTIATLLLDQTTLTNAYPTLLFSGGKNATISIGYAEALFTTYPAKENRNDVDRKMFMGRKDSIISNGSNDQLFTTLSWRTYRYIQLQIKTTTASLTIDDIYGTFIGYPFKYKAKLNTGDTALTTMLDIGWRTARLCAVETYMDCPYYEQLQYIGDARIQGVVSLYNSGDDRLFKNAINQMDNSRQPEGVTLSRHPSYTPQYIPTFSLWYIGMLHDYLMYGHDTGFIKNKLPGARAVLQYFRNFQQPDGSLRDVPYWMFTDWVNYEGWSDGVAPVGKDGSSALQDLQLLMAYQVAADLEYKTGMKSFATLYHSYATTLKKTIQKKYWDSNRKLYADRPEKDLFSQHSNILAILTGLVGTTNASSLGRQIITDTSLAPASIYFKYYLHQALNKAGFGNDYLSWLDKWRENISMGLTTWAEMSEVSTSRSDCHAWGASPNIEFFRIVLGINSDAPGFAKVRIEPHLGSLKNISGEIPHPAGKVSVNYELKNNKWNMLIELPDKIPGTFLWKERTYVLKPGLNKLQVL